LGTYLLSYTLHLLTYLAEKLVRKEL
jgi:hypothetical protein